MVPPREEGKYNGVSMKGRFGISKARENGGAGRRLQRGLARASEGHLVVILFSLLFFLILFGRNWLDDLGSFGGLALDNGSLVILIV